MAKRTNNKKYLSYYNFFWALPILVLLLSVVLLNFNLVAWPIIGGIIWFVFGLSLIVNGTIICIYLNEIPRLGFDGASIKGTSAQLAGFFLLALGTFIVLILSLRLLQVL